jgi:O-acetyl-ADP-ribose deacetylase (regulator of RNase III)
MQYAGTAIECTTGNITLQDDIDVVVNAANAQLQTGGGVAGAIHRAAGEELAQACKPKAPIEPGEAVITEAFQLPNQYVIHVLGPRYGVDEPSDELLRRGFQNALAVAAENEVTSIAFPAISTGAFHYPVDAAAEVTAHAIVDALPQEPLSLVRIVLFSGADQRVYENALTTAVAQQ